MRQDVVLSRVATCNRRSQAADSLMTSTAKTHNPMQFGSLRALIASWCKLHRFLLERSSCGEARHPESPNHTCVYIMLI